MNVAKYVLELTIFLEWNKLYGCIGVYRTFWLYIIIHFLAAPTPKICIYNFENHFVDLCIRLFVHVRFVGCLLFPFASFAGNYLVNS